MQDHESGVPPVYSIRGIADYLLKEAGRMLEDKITQLTELSQEERSQLWLNVADGVACFGSCGEAILAYRMKYEGSLQSKQAGTSK